MHHCLRNTCKVPTLTGKTIKRVGEFPMGGFWGGRRGGAFLTRDS